MMNTRCVPRAFSRAQQATARFDNDAGRNEGRHIYQLVNIKWFVYAIDMMANFWPYIGFILVINFIMYTLIN